MTTVPDLSAVRFDDLERVGLVFALLIRRVQQHPDARKWLSEIADIIDAEHALRLSTADRLLGAPENPIDPPDKHTHLGAMHVAELEILHGVLSATASEPGSGGRWLTQLLRLVEDELNRREAAQDDFAPGDPDAALHRAQSSAMDAEIERQRRADRPESDLRGIPSWREATGA